MGRLFVLLFITTSLFAQVFPGGNNSFGSGTITPSSQFGVAYYSNSGTSNTINGSSLVQTNNTLFTIGIAPASADYQTNVVQLTDTTSSAAPACSPSCTTANNTATSFLLNIGSAPDTMMENLFAQRIAFHSMIKTSLTNNGVGKAISGDVLLGASNGIAGQFNCAMSSSAGGNLYDCIGIDVTSIDSPQAGMGRVNNVGTSVAAKNIISIEGDSTVNNSGTSNQFGLYITDQADTFQANNAAGIWLAELNGLGGQSSFTPNMTPMNSGITITDGFTDSTGIWLKSTAPFANTSSRLTSSGTTITSTAGTDFTYLWGVGNSVGSTVTNATNVDSMYIAGSTCPNQVCTLNNVTTTSTVAVLTADPGIGATPALWQMVAPSQSIKLTAQNSPAVTCGGNCTYQMYLSSTPTVAGQLFMNSPVSFIWQLGGFGSGVTQMSLSNSGTQAQLNLGSPTVQGEIYINDGASHTLGIGPNGSATTSVQLLGPAAALTNNTIPKLVVSGNAHTITQSLITDNGTTVTDTGNFTANGNINTTLSSGTGANSFVNTGIASAPFFTGRNSAGTFGALTASTVAAGSLVQFIGQGYNGTSYATGGSLYFIPTQTWSSTAQGTSFNVNTTPNNTTTPVTALTIDQNGALISIPGAGTNFGTGTGSGGAAAATTFQAASGGSGGATSGTGGAGSDFLVTTGMGGSATVGSTTGRGGNAVFTLGSAGGTGTAGAPGQFEVVGGTVSGTNTTPFINITGTWNTSGLVDAGIFENITNTASGTGSKLMDLQIGGTPEFWVTSAGQVNANAGAVLAGGLQVGATQTIKFGTTRDIISSTGDQTLAITGSAGGNIGVQLSTAAQAGSLCISSTGVVTYDNTNTCLVSSRFFKHDIAPLQTFTGIGIINSLQPVSYVQNGEYHSRFGLIAEDVEKVAPRLVNEGPDGAPLQVKYLEVIPILIQAIKDQQAEIEELKKQASLSHN